MVQYEIDDFIKTVEPAHQAFARATHELLTMNDCNMKIENKTSGLFVSYSHPKTKRRLLSFLFRKSELLARLYPENASGCFSTDNIPSSMEKEIQKVPDCKIYSEKCNKCIKGYKFLLRGQTYDKCRHSPFQFAVNEESKPVLTEWIEKDVK